MVTPGRSAQSQPLHVHALKVLSRKPLTAARAARLIASVTIAITLLSGLLMHWTDHRNFPTIGRGLWWGIQTVTTVGYGDVVPRTTVGELTAALVMVVGIAFLAVTTAAVASAFIEAARRRVEATDTDAQAEALDRISTRLDAIERALARLDRRDAGSG